MIADQKQRDDALDPRRSFIVQAPAGSGKTDLLVKRYIKLLSIVEKPEEILAITFTRKAAAEMRKRVLEKIASSSTSTAEIAHRLRIQTIDAFCAALTRQTPVLARFGAQPEIIEDAGELYLEAAARVLGEYKPVTERLLAHLDNDVPAATRLLSEVLRNRDRWLGKAGAQAKAELEAALLFERNRLLKRARAIYPSSSEDLARELLTKDYDWRKKHPLAQSLSNNEPLRQALEALCKMPPPKYDDRQWEALEAILALLFPAVAQLRTLFGEAGRADFTEFSHGAVQALGAADDPSDLLLSLDQKISHILVDEFQDTSLSQFRLLERLTAGWSPEDGRTLFLVGDPMQSIYRFREAEVGLFLRARREGIGALRLEPLTLSANFRSQQGIVDWVNAAFSRILPPAEDEASGAIAYSPSSASHPPLPGPAVSWHCSYERETEAAQVVGILREAKGKTAILVRNRAHLDEIVPALKAAGLRWRAIEIEQLGERQVVQDLYALTRALLHPADRIAWLAVLRAPWCGLTLQDLHSISEDSPRELIWELLRKLDRLTPDGQKRAQRVRSALAPVLAQRNRGSLRERVEGAWLALGGPACESATGLEDAAIFLDELERLEAAGEVELEALEDKMERLFAQPDVDAGPEAVEIMTIHKSKGLEFDTVIVPGLDRLPRSGPRPLFAWKSIADGRLLLAPIDETGAGEDVTYKYVRELDREADDIEAGRLFYVAATRAKERLHLLACAKAAEDLTPKEPTRRTLLGKIWWQAREHFGPAPAAAGDAPRAPLPDFLRRLPTDFALPEAPHSTVWNPPPEGRAEEPIEFSWAGETARHVGTVVHRWLQRIAQDEMKGWNDEKISSLKPAFLSDLSRRGVPQADLETSSERVVDALRRTLADERGRWLLGPQNEAKTEYRLRTAAHATYIVDRTFRDASGELWVVDWKTSRHEGRDLEGFLANEQARYAPQLERYAAALGATRLGLYFPALASWREWSRDK
jgi:ATP-dependent exoDNAse (exonuclease V) beta subunit